MLLYQVLISTTYEIINWKGQTWNDEFELPGESYSISDIQDYFQYNIENHETPTNNLPLKVNINKIKKRITFKIKTEIILNSEHLKQRNYLEALKTR